MDEKVMVTFDESLRRCDTNPSFLDIFYEKFLASSAKVREKFARTDFVHQKRALRGSLHMMLLAAENEDKGPDKYLRDLAISHSRPHLDIGAELYDLWLDSLLQAVKECDPEYSPEVEEAWEEMMGIGIRYMLEHFHHS